MRVSLCICTISFFVLSGLCSSLSDEATPDECGDYDYEADSDLDEEEIFEDMEDLSDVSSVQSVSSCATAQHVQVKDKPKVNQLSRCDCRTRTHSE